MKEAKVRWRMKKINCQKAGKGRQKLARKINRVEKEGKAGGMRTGNCDNEQELRMRKRKKYIAYEE